MALSVNRIYATPAVQPVEAPKERFSEARALDTVKDLTEKIGFRIVCPCYVAAILCRQQAASGP